MALAPPLGATPPLAKRLNRNALTVAAVLLGMTALTAVVVVRPSRERPGPSPGERSADEAPAPPPRPAFLDQPPRLPAASPESLPALPVGAPEAHGRPGSPSFGAASTPAEDSAWRAVVLPRASDTALPAELAPGPRAGLGTRSSRRRSFAAALRSAAVVRAAPGAASAGTEPEGPAPAPSLAPEEEQLLGLGDSVLRAAARGSAAGLGAARPSGHELAGWGGGGGEGRGGGGGAATAGEEPRAFLDRSGDRKGATVITRVEPAGSPWTLRAGSVIPALLLTAINSELPGDVVAQVSRDVYDSRTEQAVLVPKGARLIGTYDHHVVAGAGRLLIAWTRLVLPDGRSLTLPGLAEKDLSGETGAEDQVDTHWSRVLANALLLSGISAGVQLSQPRQTSVLAPPSTGEIAAGALGQELSNVALGLVERGMDAPPTIRIRQGLAFNVFLNGDLVFDGPYEERRPSVP